MLNDILAPAALARFAADETRRTADAYARLGDAIMVDPADTRTAREVRADDAAARRFAR